ncbi:MAG TPA: rhodanese-like domain-containing protein [Chthoniobacterales bacterium]|jgi:3-mercaptopyruvate sulfurtransferase SseA
MTALIVAVIAWLGMPEIEWYVLKQSLRNRFPQVDWIATRDLAYWLADPNRPPPLLLDVRTPEEWNVSHLPGARRVEPNATAENAAAGLPKDTPIVTYCAVGYRSAGMSVAIARGRI